MTSCRGQQKAALLLYQKFETVLQLNRIRLGSDPCTLYFIQCLFLLSEHIHDEEKTEIKMFALN